MSHFAGVTTSNFVSASAWVKLDTLGSGGADDSAIIGSHANDDHMFLLWYNEDGAGANPSYSFNVGSTATSPIVLAVVPAVRWPIPGSMWLVPTTWEPRRFM